MSHTFVSCSEWRCAQPEETSTALQTPKGWLQQQPLEGWEEVATHPFTALCVFQHKVRESGKFVITTQTQTPKLWMDVSSRQWVGAEGTCRGCILHAQRHKHSVLSKLHVPKIERKYSLVTSCPQPHTESLLSVNCRMTKYSKYCFFSYLFTETTTRCKSLEELRTQFERRITVFLTLAVSDISSSELNQLLTAWSNRKLDSFKGSVLSFEANFNYTPSTLCNISKYAIKQKAHLMLLNEM